MMRIRLKPQRRAGLLAARLALLVLPVAVVIGCGDDDGGGSKPTATATVVASTPPAVRTNTAAVPTNTAPVPTNTAPPATNTPPPASTSTATPLPTNTTPPATPTANASANAACDKLTGCAQCFINATGQCIPTNDCAQRLSADAAICINGVTGCDPRTLGDCLFPGCDGNDATGECQ